MLGCATIGNATLIAYEDKPILVTDPWLGDESPVYFGSWSLSHKIPAGIRSEILDTEYVWFSHGHPYHFDIGSLQKFTGKKILLADHVGGRIADYLREEGFEVSILPDREWVQLSPRVKVFCISTWIQDSILLVDVGGRLFVNLNDAGDCDCTLTLKRIISQYQHSYLLVLCACHDVDMFNFWTEDGNFILPPTVLRDAPGQVLSDYPKRLGAKSAIPFSSFHSYQRSDPVWARDYTRSLDEYEIGFDQKNVEFVPAFSRINCETGEVLAIDPPSTDDVIRPPEEFGDNWTDQLDPGDVDRIEAYFRRRERVRDNFKFLNFRVGGKDNIIALDGNEDRGLTFEALRGSLMTAIDYEVFDDLLIGNFMKTTMHNVEILYDHGFTFATAKWGDNGRAFTEQEIDEYIKVYKKRAGLDWVYSRYYRHSLSQVGTQVKRLVPAGGPVYRAAQKVFHMLT